MRNTSSVDMTTWYCGRSDQKRISVGSPSLCAPRTRLRILVTFRLSLCTISKVGRCGAVENADIYCGGSESECVSVVGNLLLIVTVRS